MMNVSNRFDPTALCSRKLWQLVAEHGETPISEAELHEAVAELAARRRYLAELKKIGKLGKITQG